MNHAPEVELEELSEIQVVERSVEQKQLVLFNDHVNTFDHVIDCLVEVCGHEPIQAEQCATITHYKGKCSVKRGDLSKLTPFHASLSEKGLTVEIQ